MEEHNELKEKIAALVENPDQAKGKDFRLKLEALVNTDPEEAEYPLIQYLLDHNLNPEIRTEIIRIAGSLQQSSYLVPLKKIIDTEQHSRLLQEAIIAVAKFNDRRALNILTQALIKLNNPLLNSTINNEIARIKENNPLLALMPRFQEGQKNPKVFNNTLQILKRILTPADATVFTKFLTNPDPLIKNGAFELLCLTGDIFHDAEILEYYEDTFNKIKGKNDKECEPLYLLTYHFKIYLSRYQFLIEEQLPNLQRQYTQIKDIRVKQILISLICKSKNASTLEFLGEVYETDSSIRSTIIEELSGNESAFDFLFQQYQSDKDLKEKIIQSLLNIKQGLDYFISNFFTLAFEEQELVARNLPYAGQHDLKDFIQQIFQSNLYRLKEILLSKLSETYDFSARDLLFDPEREREFAFMGDQYLDAIAQLFPVTTVKHLLGQMVIQDIYINKSRKNLWKTAEITASELIINFKDEEFVKSLFNKIIRANNLDLNLDFLEILKSLKTLDITTYQNLNHSLGLFVSLRETKLSTKERGELSRIKRNLQDVYYELKRIEDGRAAMDRLYKADDMDFEAMTHILKAYPLSTVMYKDRLLNVISRHFQKCTSKNVGEWGDFFNRFPRITGAIKTMIEHKVHLQSDIAYKPLEDFIDTLSGNPVRIVMNFKNRYFLAVLQEEFQEVNPGIPVIINDYDLKDMDLLLCDAEMLRDIVLMGKGMPEKIFLFIEKLEGVSDFSIYKTKNYVKPFQFYRIIKEILQECFV